MFSLGSIPRRNPQRRDKVRRQVFIGWENGLSPANIDPITTFIDNAVDRRFVPGVRIEVMETVPQSHAPADLCQIAVPSLKSPFEIVRSRQYVKEHPLSTIACAGLAFPLADIHAPSCTRRHWPGYR